MVASIFSRVAFATGLLASTASAAYDASAKSNVAVYWGQGSNQMTLLEVCLDPNVDIVNIGFVNKFPKKRGEYPGTNHANACGDATYTDPTTNQPSKLLSSCPGVGEAINACKRRGKKVMLSLGGGWPTDYYLPTPDVANWFAEFLLGAYGPPTAEWKAAGKPRPFGDAYVDGFDLDLEAAEWDVPSADMLYANYDVFGKYIKAHSKMLLSGAPQCVVPDARIFLALKEVPFDFLFTQFYNTWTCSAAKAVQDMKNNAESTFTFNTWISWLKNNSKNPDIKLYLGLAAGEDGLPTHKDHYLAPEDANMLVQSLQGDSMFGGIMLWEATVSKNNPTYDQSYGTWMKYAVQGTFKDKYHPVVSSSSVVSSTITPSSTPASSISASSTPASSTPASSIPASSIPASSIPASSVPASSVPASSTPASSTPASSTPISSVSASSYPASSVSASSIPGSSISASSIPVSSTPISSVSASSIPASSIPASNSVTMVSSSSIEIPSSTPVGPSSVPTVSAPESIGSSVVVPSGSETSTSCSTSNGAYPTGVNSSYGVYPTESAVYPIETYSASKGAEYPAESSKGYGEYPAASSTGYDSTPSVTKKPEQSEYPTVPTGSTTSVVTTTYVDVCPTGLTTVTTTYVATVCTKCAKPTGTADVPEGWTTSVYTASTLTVTITKPVATVTAVPEYPSSAPSVVYPAEYSATPISSGKPAYPAVPEASKVAYPTIPEVSKAAYPAVPEVSKAAYPTVPEVSKAAYPAVPEVSKVAEYPVAPASSAAPEYPAHSMPSVPSAAQPASSPAAEYPLYPVGTGYPKKPVEHEAVSSMHVTLSKVAVSTYIPAPYPSAGVPYIPAGPAKNATSVYVPMPTGTGKPVTPLPSMPPQFEGVASRASVGFMMFVGAVGAVFAM